MTLNSEVIKSRDLQIEAWKRVRNLIGTERTRTSGDKMAALIDMSPNVLKRSPRLWANLDLAKVETIFKWQDQQTYWTCLVDAETGAKRIWDYFDSGRTLTTLFPKKAPKPVSNGLAVTEDPGEETKAIVGEDAPKPFASLASVRKDEAEALIAAARQYAKRNDAVIAKLAELEAMGVVVNHDTIMKSIKIGRNSDLEAVANVLPYIDRLERQASMGLDARNKVSELTAENTRLLAELRKEKDGNRRLSERNIQLASLPRMS